MKQNLISDKAHSIIDAFKISKKYCFVYLIFIAVSFFSMITKSNLIQPKFELLIFVIVAVLGILCIVYYFLNKSDENLYKVAFVVILCFGLICSLLIPIGSVSDEPEHFTRAEITSQGVILPHWTGEDLGLTRTYNENGTPTVEGKLPGFHTIASSKFISDDRGLTVFESDKDTDKINTTDITLVSAFEQNMFFSYLPQAIGIFIAKLLDLNVVWMMWLGRMFNLLCYASLISYAVKKTPHLKIPLLAVACIPIAIFQAASISIDSMIIGLGILAIAYFIYLYSTENLGKKDIAIFSVICLLLGLCKLTYLTFIFLLLLIPKENFKDDKNSKWHILLSIIIVALIGVLWSRHSAPLLLHSWRSAYNSSVSLQLQYLVNHPGFILKFFNQVIHGDLPYVVNGVFNFFTPGKHPLYHDQYYLVTYMLQAFLVIVLFAYPNKFRFDLKARFGTLFIFLLTYWGTSFVQLLSWAEVGKTNLGISIRYFIPLIALLPIILSVNVNDRNEEFDKYAMVLIIGFLGALLLSFATKYY